MNFLETDAEIQAWDQNVQNVQNRTPLGSVWWIILKRFAHISSRLILVALSLVEGFFFQSARPYQTLALTRWHKPYDLSVSAVGRYLFKTEGFDSLQTIVWFVWAALKVVHRYKDIDRVDAIAFESDVMRRVGDITVTLQVVDLFIAISCLKHQSGLLNVGSGVAFLRKFREKEI